MHAGFILCDILSNKLLCKLFLLKNLHMNFQCKCSGQPGAKRRGGPGGLNKICAVSPELQTIVGEPTMARTQVNYDFELSKRSF